MLFATVQKNSTFRNPITIIVNATPPPKNVPFLIWKYDTNITNVTETNIIEFCHFWHFRFKNLHNIMNPSVIHIILDLNSEFYTYAIQMIRDPRYYDTNINTYTKYPIRFQRNGNRTTMHSNVFSSILSAV